MIKPNAPAVVQASGATTYAEFSALADAWASHLQQEGVGEGRVVALCGEVRLAYLAALLGVWRVGAWAMPIPTRLPQAGVEERIALTSAHVIDDFALAPAAMQPCAAPGNFLPETGGVIVATSGSSGAPKLAMLTLRALRANADRSNRNLPVGETSRWLLSLPLFHVSGLGVLLRMWSSGGAVALPETGCDLPDALAALRPTHVSLVATQLHRLLQSPEGVARTADLEAILLGGSAIPRSLIVSAHAAGLRIFKSYGLTEMGSQVATTTPGASLAELYTSGRPLDPDSLAISGEGEILVRGATLFSGYWQAGAAPRLPLTHDAYYATGDLGYLDDAGRLVVQGRRDAMFISGGENVHPEQVERVLAGLPGVEQAVVVGVHDAEYGALGAAFVAMTAGLGLEGERLRAELKEQLAPWAVPRWIFPWPTDLDTGGIKPSRSALASRAAALLTENEGGR